MYRPINVTVMIVLITIPIGFTEIRGILIIKYRNWICLTHKRTHTHSVTHTHGAHTAHTHTLQAQNAESNQLVPLGLGRVHPPFIHSDQQRGFANSHRACIVGA
jgi:hypothetical protein